MGLRVELDAAAELEFEEGEEEEEEVSGGWPPAGKPVACCAG
jgi:hypothetical protein